jgi:hypothetical protein
LELIRGGGWSGSCIFEDGFVGSCTRLFFQFKQARRQISRSDKDCLLALLALVQNTAFAEIELSSERRKRPAAVGSSSLF